MEQMQESRSHTSESHTSEHAVDEIDRARVQEYALLATLLSRSPDSQMIGRLASLRGDASPLGSAHAALGQAAVRADEAAQIPRRTPILERLHEREQQNMEYGGIDK